MQQKICTTNKNKMFCYVIFYSLSDELTTEDVRLEAFLYNPLIYNKVAQSTEFEADNYALERIKRSFRATSEEETPQIYHNFMKSGDSDDLGENAYWIISMRGDKDEITKLLSNQVDVYDRMLYIVNSGRSVLLKKDSITKEITVDYNPTIKKPSGKPINPYQSRKNKISPQFFEQLKTIEAGDELVNKLLEAAEREPEFARTIFSNSALLDVFKENNNKFYISQLIESNLNLAKDYLEILFPLCHFDFWFMQALKCPELAIALLDSPEMIDRLNKSQHSIAKLIDKTVIACPAVAEKIMSLSELRGQIDRDYIINSSNFMYPNWRKYARENSYLKEILSGETQREYRI